MGDERRHYASSSAVRLERADEYIAPRLKAMPREDALRCLMIGFRQFASYLSPQIVAVVLFAFSEMRAENCCDPKGPYRLGEEHPETPATCENIKYWADRAPRTEDRISLGITGKLMVVKFDGTLAYLLMCEPPGTQVLCVTYSTNGLEPGDVVLFGGGYRRVGEKQIMLDPCLASR